MRIEALTFFRFLAASTVVIFHFGIPTFGANNFTVSGPKMVTFFFVLSGFVMGLAYLKKEVNFARYWYDRAARILPVYLLALYLMIEFNNIPLTSTEALLNLTLLQSWVPTYPLTINAPGWSLSVEAFFYLLFPFLLLIIQKYKIQPLILLIIAILFWLITQFTLTIALTYYYGGYPSPSHDLIFYFPFSHLSSFLLGLAGACLIQKYSFRVKSNIGTVLILSFALSLIYIVLEIQLPLFNLLKVRLPFDSSFIAIFFLILILASSICQAPIMKVFSFKPIVLIGEASFSLYILQMPVYIYYNKTIKPFLSESEHLNFYLYFTLLLTLSILSFLLFERPINNFMRYQLRPYLNSANSWKNLFIKKL
jgi:peptidoglycan/LPS O-acetylase OafA/YrhL